MHHTIRKSILVAPTMREAPNRATSKDTGLMAATRYHEGNMNSEYLIEQFDLIWQSFGMLN